MTQDPVWQEEKKRLGHVLERIQEEIKRTEALSEERLTTVAEARKDFWSDISVNLSNRDDIMETYAAITQQSMMLGGQERSLQHAEDNRYRLLRMYNSPYFGRIDFTEDGTDDTQQIYIGIGSVLDEETQTYWVYDWRAPVSSLFYDYPPGPASYKTPAGTIDGQLELKRQYMIRGGELKALFDTGVTIGDEVLQEILGGHADDRMKSIVATIQSEQNRIIRDDTHPVLIVQGAAGSGKTSVALQRVAYLMYKHRQTLHADNMVLFSPNALFNSYVASVLPELGEANMQQTTYQEYLRLRLSRQFEVEDAYDQIETLLGLSPEDSDYELRTASIRFKSSRAYIEVIERYAKRLEKEGMLFQDLIFRGRVLISRERMAEEFYRLDPGLKLSNKLHLLKEWLLKELKELAKLERRKSWVKKEIELLDKEDYQRAYNALQKQAGEREVAFDDAQQEALLLAKFVVHERFKSLRSRIKALRFVSGALLYKQMLSDESWTADDATLSLPGEWDAVRLWTLERMEAGQLPYEDATPLLYLTGLMEGFHSYNAVRHVLIDEAQDYSAFQLAFLRRLFPRARMTLLGDFNQAIYAHTHGGGDTADTGYGVVYDLFGKDQVELIRLVRSYRSTRNIVDFTLKILPAGEPVEAFNRSGEDPRILQVKDTDELHRVIAQEVARLREKGQQSIAVICKTASEARSANDALSSLLQTELITKDTRIFPEGVLVLPAYLAKGLEFDAVIVYNASGKRYGNDNERKLLYTACTRAMHQLTVCAVGSVSPLLD
ncbi:RNA polymerase recycling motor HelD [Paenibacillus mucilaginosus]|uniref:ATP-dependent DNA helicase replicase n=2 Tax=Paenibacillus mucilaginosus TaxID=61624 RepID=H6NSS3_9BACL|nr:RNA polymerase recycling motor HelD [Paenibacillus mucilaginosus]AEI38675.1 ATP-dependent DNA helicase replicase [Paenibacillus mucilaginosus KNP414]AFC27013.1 ATP-dependent DNA helicase replicase [Paenibacillus mucilaginosus 3016]MCG7215814.1 UvrD-helicase domain-containing protein [Paenibacillus mucilaginosus]WDM27764.1 UvrD-helicase domain-containing protein [Paenibacillus mucilaginosus]WFA15949.1 helicase [Paenibacillus mucilaginosus]